MTLRKPSLTGLKGYAAFPFRNLGVGISSGNNNNCLLTRPTRRRLSLGSDWLDRGWSIVLLRLLWVFLSPLWGCIKSFRSLSFLIFLLRRRLRTLISRRRVFVRWLFWEKPRCGSKLNICHSGQGFLIDLKVLSALSGSSRMTVHEKHFINTNQNKTYRWYDKWYKERILNIGPRDSPATMDSQGGYGRIHHSISCRPSSEQSTQ